MNTLHALIPALVERIAWTVVHSLWQGTAIVAVLAFALVLLRHRSAALRHTLCALALLGMAVCAGITMTRIHPTTPVALAPATGATAPRELPVTSSATSSTAAPPVAAIPPEPGVPIAEAAPRSAGPMESAAPDWQAQLTPFLPWIAAGWMLGVIGLTLRHLGGWMRIRSWRHSAAAPAAEVQRLLDPILAQFAASSRVAVRISQDVLSPMLTGVLRPIVLFPAQVLTGLTREELRAVLAHELAHWARRDSWVNLMQVALETLFFYHPAAWWIGRRMRSEREHAADDRALAVTRDRRVYAGALVRLVEMQSVPAFAIPARGGAFVQRIRRILRPAPESAPAWPWPGIFVSAIMAAALIIPVIAQDPPTITVNPGESIQAAIDKAPEGAVIKLGEGTWKERVVIKKPLTLEGAGWGKTILKPDQPDPAVAKRRAETEQRAKATTSRDQQSRIYKEAGHLDEPTITVEGTEKVSIRGLRIQGLLYPDRDVKNGLYPDALVRIQQASAEFRDCAIVGYYCGVNVAAKGNATIRNSIVAAMWNTGVNVAPDARLHFTDGEVRNCYYSGIVIARGNQQTVIENSRISGTAWHGIRYDDAAPVIRNSVFTQVARCDLYASGRTRATVEGNLFLSGGVWALLGNQDTFTGNTFHGPRATLGVSGGATPRIVRNLFIGAETAIPCGTVSGDSSVAETPGAPILEGNQFWNVKKPMIAGKDDVPLPAGNTVADPQWVVTADGRQSLAATSNARISKVGAADPLSPISAIALFPEEKAIIPDGETRDFQYWKTPGQPQRSKRGDQQMVDARAKSDAWVKDALQLDDEARRNAAIEAIRQAIQSDDPNTIRTGMIGFQRILQVAFDKASFRPALRKLLAHAEADIRATACGVLAGTGKSDEDVALVIPLTRDGDPAVKKAAVSALRWLTGGDFTGDTGRAVQAVLEGGNTQFNKDLWGTMWGTKVSPEIEAIIVQASRKDDRGTGYSDVFYHALCTHLSKREPTVTRLIELLATEDPVNVGGRVLWGLQQGVAADQKPRVAEAALKVIAARDDGYMRREAFDCLRMYGTRRDAESLRKFMEKPGVTGDFRKTCEDTLKVIESRDVAP